MQFGLPLSKVDRPILTSRQMSVRSSEIEPWIGSGLFSGTVRTLPNTGRARFVGRSVASPLASHRGEFGPAIQIRVNQRSEAAVLADTTAAERTGILSRMR